jgi:FkbM family methyltransferase
MLIPVHEIKEVLSTHGISVRGAFHVGAHDCEEMAVYDQMGLSREAVVWVDAMEHKVAEARARGVTTAYCAAVSDTDDVETNFNIANNGQSSSLLEFGTHAIEHPHVVFVARETVYTVTVDTFFARYNIDCAKHNFWNFDIQGAELMALRGAERSLSFADALYLEVNAAPLYQGCALVEEIDEFLAPRGFSRVITNMTEHGWGDALYVREGGQSPPFEPL